MTQFTAGDKVEFRRKDGSVADSGSLLRYAGDTLGGGGWWVVKLFDGAEVLRHSNQLTPA